jgi:hypothetical protein
MKEDVESADTRMNSSLRRREMIQMILDSGTFHSLAEMLISLSD